MTTKILKLFQLQYKKDLKEAERNFITVASGNADEFLLDLIQNDIKHFAQQLTKILKNDNTGTS